MIRRALQGRQTSPEMASKLMVYTLATAFHISPIEVYNMPAEMFRDFMIIHGAVEEYKNQEIENIQRKMK